VVFATACETTATVTIDGHSDGSGVVSLLVEMDTQAVTQLGGTKTLLLDDVRKAGWVADEPVNNDDGSAEIAASKSYANSEELSLVLEELGGSVFSDTSSTVVSEFAKTEYAISTNVAVTGSLDEFSDAPLTELLGGLPLGRTPEEAAAAGLLDPGRGGLVVTVKVPGEQSESTETFDLTSGEPQSAEVAAVALDSNQTVWLMLAAGAVGLILGLVLILTGLRKRSRSGDEA